MHRKRLNVVGLVLLTVATCILGVPRESRAKSSQAVPHVSMAARPAPCSIAE